MLAICSGLHLLIIIFSLPGVTHFAEAQKESFSKVRAGRLIGLAFLIVVIGHLLQIWIWALAYIWVEAIESFEPALYFAMSNYTTLGYGDLLLGEDLRLFAAFASVNGMLIFGVSTAYLVGIIGRVLQGYRF